MLLCESLDHTIAYNTFSLSPYGTFLSLHSVLSWCCSVVLIQVRGSLPQLVKPQSKESKEEDTHKKGKMLKIKKNKVSEFAKNVLEQK